MARQPICDEYQMGLTQATMFPVAWYGLPIPTASPYTPYSISKVCGNMRSKGYGFPTVVWQYTNLSQYQMGQILAFFPNEQDASVDMYIRTYKDVGRVRQAANFSTIMYRPVDGSDAAIMANSAFHWANIRLRFAHLVEL